MQDERLENGRVELAIAVSSKPVTKNTRPLLRMYFDLLSLVTQQ